MFDDLKVLNLIKFSTFMRRTEVYERQHFKIVQKLTENLSKKLRNRKIIKLLTLIIINKSTLKTQYQTTISHFQLAFNILSKIKHVLSITQKPKDLQTFPISNQLYKLGFYSKFCSNTMSNQNKGLSETIFSNFCKRNTNWMNFDLNLRL